MRTVHNRIMPWEKLIIGLVGAVGGGALSAWIRSRYSTANQLRDDLSDRVRDLEDRLNTVESKLDKWKAAYWQLYAWIHSVLTEHDIEYKPPEFINEMLNKPDTP